jgi:hypothetical protein
MPNLRYRSVMFNRWSYSLARIFRFEVVSKGVLREKFYDCTEKATL